MKKMVILSIMVITWSAVTFGQNIKDFQYKTEKGGITITGYKGRDTTVRIPETIKGTPVTAIGYQAFAFARLESIYLPDSLKYIDTAAFFDNQITNIVLPDSLVFIGDSAFSFNRISSIVIPESVKTIGANAFLKNRLTSISLPDNVNIQYNSFYLPVFEKYSGNEKGKAIFSIAIVLFDKYKIAILDDSAADILAYYGKDDKLVLPGSVDGIPVIGIENGVFSSCYLTSVVLPDSVEYIGDHAFNNNKLTEIVFPDSVQNIGIGAFTHNQISTVDMSNSLAAIGNAAFSSNQLTNVTLPESLISIGFSAFLSNNLSKVTIPNSVKSIGDMVFDPDVRVDREQPHSSMTEKHS